MLKSCVKRVGVKNGVKLKSCVKRVGLRLGHSRGHAKSNAKHAEVMCKAVGD